MTYPPRREPGTSDIAVIGTGISGLSAAWLLSRRHRVTVFEKEDRLGGHSNTVEVPLGNGKGPVHVDTGFIVYNEPNYPNLKALFDHLDVPTKASDMSFAVFMGDGALEYSGTGLSGLFAQPGNAFRPRFWSMLREVLRFYREAPELLAVPEAETMTLGAFLRAGNYSHAFIHDHLLPMAAAIWSAPASTMLDYPVFPFIRFCENHGLLRLSGRPVWRTVEGGSIEYVRRIGAGLKGRIRLCSIVHAIHRRQDGVLVEDRNGDVERFDHVVLATHADQALALLPDADPLERRLLGAFPYQRNIAILHTDRTLMPRRPAAWSSWNVLSAEGGDDSRAVCVTYWMNRLQGLGHAPPLFVTLNPLRPPRDGTVLRSFLYDHPLFGPRSLPAQRALWSLQGRRNTWFCGAYFGAGFHEDGLQAGLAVAEALGGLRRPWTVENESGRIHLSSPDSAALAEAS